MKLLNINKYFNKGKSNELHVLNDISVDFPSKGLVAIMGQSGSGKTTLLNVLCGLDKVNSGVIEVGEKQISKYSSHTWDQLRNKEFGYIFQNYNIFEDRSVFDNVSLSLDFLGMRDKEEIRTRVMQALELVGMDKYRNRPAGALSGGEMQRVAIARALVKDPTIMIADEPTGNLDEKNTIMIMNILKKISKDRLVILVTHEKEIGEFYADTIVHISDGKIVDIVDGSNDELKLYADNTIYLQDLNKDVANNNKVTLASYYSNNFDAEVKVEIILEGNDIIINATSPSKNIKYATNDSNITIVDGKKPQLTKDEIEKNISSVETVKPLNKDELSCKYNIGLFKHIKKGFERVFDLSKFKKLFLLGFVISAALLVLSFSAYVGVGQVDEKDFLRYDRNLIEVEYKDANGIEQKYEELKMLIDNGKVNYFYQNQTKYNYIDEMPGILYFKFNKISSYNQGYALEATFTPYDRVKNYSYVIPQKGEVVIDRFIVEQLYTIGIQNGNTIQNDELLLKTKVIFGNKEFKIVGVSETNNGCVYINPQDAYEFNFYNVSAYNGQIDTVEALNKGEVAIICSTARYQVGNNITINGHTYRVGAIKTIESDEVFENIYMSKDDIDYLSFAKSIELSKSILVSSDLRVKELKKCFNSSEIKTVEKMYKLDYKDASNEKLLIARVLLVFAVVTIVAPLIFLFFLMRSNLISRVKEVGIYRALGLSRLSVLKMHASEAIAISATGTLLGWIFGVFMIYKLRTIEYARFIFSGNPFVLVGCLVLCVLINLVVGCIPIVVLLGKTPQQILSKYDI